MRRVFITVLMLAFLLVQGQDPKSLLSQGNEAYQKESFQEAISLYDSVQNMGYTSAALHYNLGNAYYKTGQLAPAILHYERALLLQPGDEDVLHNLELAREKTVDRFETMPEPPLRKAYRSFVQLFSPDMWAKIGLWILALIIPGLALYFFTTWRRTGFVIALCALLLGLGSLGGAWAHEQYREAHRGAVVMSPSAYVKSGPAQSAEDVFILHEGTKVTVIETFESWHKISLPDGKRGWIQSKNLEVI